MTVFDAKANLASALVTVPPAPAGSGLSLTVDDASLFPTAPFNATVYPPDVCATEANAEIVRVTGVVGNVFTIERAQEGTTAQAIAAGWQIENGVTVLSFTEIEDAINALEADMLTAVILMPTTDARNVIQPSDATVVPLTVKGFAAQSDDLLQFQDSTAAVLSRFNEIGWLGIGVDPLSPLHVAALADNLATVNLGGVPIQFGSGGPAGVVPVADGAIYIDNVRGGIYSYSAPFVNDWVRVGGQLDDSQPLAGVATTSVGGVMILVEGSGNNYGYWSDTLADIGTLDGIYWHTTGVDGDQSFEVWLGAGLEALHFDKTGALFTPVLTTGVPIKVKGLPAQTGDLQQWSASSGEAFLRVAPGGQLVAGGQNPLINPASYGFSAITEILIARASDGYYSSQLSPTFAPGASQSVVPLLIDATTVPTADGFSNFTQGYGIFSSLRSGGTKTTRELYAIYAEAALNGTKGAGTGAQIGVLRGLSAWAFTGADSTGDVTTIIGVDGIGAHNGNGTVGSIFGVRAQASLEPPTAGTQALTVEVTGIRAVAEVEEASGTAVPIVQGIEIFEVSSMNRAVTLARGLHVKNIGPVNGAAGTVAAVVKSYGIHIDKQEGSSDPYSIYSAGGKSLLEAGSATVVPLTLRGAAAQSGKLLVFQNSALTELMSVPAAGGLTLVGQKITGMADPTLAQDAATKQYVDAFATAMAVAL